AALRQGLSDALSSASADVTIRALLSVQLTGNGPGIGHGLGRDLEDGAALSLHVAHCEHHDSGEPRTMSRAHWRGAQSFTACFVLVAPYAPPRGAHKPSPLL